MQVETAIYPSLRGKTVFITGGGSGIGASIVEHFCAQGWGDPLTHRRLPVTPADPYVEQMRNFADVIRGQAAPAVSGAEGLRTLAAIMAIGEAAASGQAVRIDDILNRHRRKV